MYSSQNGLLPKLNKGSNNHHPQQNHFLKRTLIKFKSQYKSKETGFVSGQQWERVAAVSKIELSISSLNSTPVLFSEHIMSPRYQ